MPLACPAGRPCGSVSADVFLAQHNDISHPGPAVAYLGLPWPKSLASPENYYYSIHASHNTTARNTAHAPAGALHICAMANYRARPLAEVAMRDNQQQNTSVFGNSTVYCHNLLPKHHAMTLRQMPSWTTAITTQQTKQLPEEQPHYQPRNQRPTTCITTS